MAGVTSKVAISWNLWIASSESHLDSQDPFGDVAVPMVFLLVFRFRESFSSWATAVLMSSVGFHSLFLLALEQQVNDCRRRTHLELDSSVLSDVSKSMSSCWERSIHSVSFSFRSCCISSGEFKSKY